ncbi:hypothetical protein SDC9_164366 [bioreactor metagenome]|uniref:Uncharacterized protein n=1 Tax=bioreactor metagenome TaxID=1076179 RepID=A0A645FRG4_9ZZZZ
MRIGRLRGVSGDQHGVAIRRRLGHVLRGNHAAGPGLVVHHHRLLGLGGDRLTQGTRQQIGGAARRKRHDEGDGLGGIVRRLRLRAPPQRQRADGQRHQVAPRRLELLVLHALCLLGG